VRVRIGRIASDDLIELAKYIERDNAAAAAKLSNGILDACEMLSDFPEMAQVAANIRGWRVRRMVHKRVSIYYIINRLSGIVVVRILYKGRNWKRLVSVALN
jgi:plasmid stabilization system protein ParE